MTLIPDKRGHYDGLMGLAWQRSALSGHNPTHTQLSANQGHFVRGYCPEVSIIGTLLILYGETACMKVLNSWGEHFTPPLPTRTHQLPSLFAPI